MPKLKMINVSNFHAQYSDLTTQHWSVKSESFAGGDNLITAIARGWDIEECVLVTHWYAGMRSVRIYQFTISKEDKIIIMPVHDNPYVERFIVEQNIELTEADASS